MRQSSAYWCIIIDNVPGIAAGQKSHLNAASHYRCPQLVCWDNRSMLHSTESYDYDHASRHMHLASYDYDHHHHKARRMWGEYHCEWVQ